MKNNKDNLQGMSFVEILNEMKKSDPEVLKDLMGRTGRAETIREGASSVNVSELFQEALRQNMENEVKTDVQPICNKLDDNIKYNYLITVITPKNELDELRLYNAKIAKVNDFFIDGFTKFLEYSNSGEILSIRYIKNEYIYALTASPSLTEKGV